MIEFFVPGVPRPKGSMRWITRGKGGRPLPNPIPIQDNPKTKAWQQTVRNLARVYVAEKLEGPVSVELHFYFERPKSHVGARGQILKGKLSYPGHRNGDTDKLERAVLDGLQKIAFEDDTQVVDLRSKKRYLPPGIGRPGCRVTIASVDLDNDNQCSLEI